MMLTESRHSQSARNLTQIHINVLSCPVGLVLTESQCLPLVGRGDLFGT